MKAVVAAFNQEKALVGAFSVITNLRMELFEALHLTPHNACPGPGSVDTRGPGWRLLDPETMSPMVCCVCSQDIAGTRITWCTTADIMT